MSDDKHWCGFASQCLMTVEKLVINYTLGTCTASLFYTKWETQMSEYISLCPKAVCLLTYWQKIKEKSTLPQKNRENSGPCLLTIVDDTRIAVAKDLTWVLVIIPALSLAYLCNLGLNKALWNTICTNRHFKSYFHPYG